ncbi:hypothetical protein BHE74_00009899 [Ensete ventricosum]|nr:hypothetical protein BHE74_00009899 [Ensete ventricosum]
MEEKTAPWRAGKFPTAERRDRRSGDGSDGVAYGTSPRVLSELNKRRSDHVGAFYHTARVITSIHREGGILGKGGINSAYVSRFGWRRNDADLVSTLMSSGVGKAIEGRWPHLPLRLFFSWA